jgi:hypothetical protein
MHAFIEYQRLAGDAANPPLVVQRGFPDQLAIGFGATRSFDIEQPRQRAAARYHPT